MKQLLFAMCGVLIGLAALLPGCNRGSSAAAPESARATSEALPANLFVETAPPGAIDVAAAKKSIKDGQSVVIKGRVGGQKEPLAPSRAIVTLSDLALRTCDKSPMDKCSTPWDSCCEPQDEIAASSLTVQVVGAGGQPIKAGLAGVEGIAPMKQLIVAGIAKTLPGSDAIIVEARQIYVTP
jgi:hypothetical protein